MAESERPARVRPVARAAAGLLPLVWTGALVVAGGPARVAAQVSGASGSVAGCAVEIEVGSASATAVVVSGCQGSDYWFSSWQTPSASYQPGAPQQLLDATNHAPWTVVLPSGQNCFYQLDFSERQTPPGHSGSSPARIASLIGTTPACSVSTTSTASTSSTTVVPSSTSVAPSTATTTAILPATTVALSLPTTPPTVAVAAAKGTTTTSTIAAAPPSQPPQALSPPGDPVPAGATAGSNRTGSLAFTGFALLMAVFVAAVLIAAGLGIARAGRASRRTH